MDLATIALAAAEGGAEHADKSHTFFYVAGGALAAFAVIVAAIGIMRPNLPEGPNRAIMGIGAVLVVVTMVASIASS
jgi:hypothetical protein